MARERILVYRDDVPIEALCIAASSAGLLEVFPFSAPADPESSFTLVPMLQERTRSIPWTEAFRIGTELACGEAFSNACRHGDPGTEICGLILLLGSGRSTSMLLVVENRVPRGTRIRLPRENAVAFPRVTSTHGWGFAMMHAHCSTFRVAVEPGKRVVLVLLFVPKASVQSSR